MKAAGLTLVLCYYGSSNTKSFLYKIIEDDQFSELHIHILNKNFLNDYLKFMKDIFISKYVLLKGFIYLFTKFYDKYSINWILINYFKEIPRTEVISFSIKPDKALIKINFLPTEPFSYYKTGFNCKYLRVYLSFVPIHDKKFIQLFTNKISGFSLCYISPNDFHFLENSQVDALFEDENHHHSYSLLNFDDLHFVRSDLFVNDTLSLIQMDKEMHKSIDLILSKISNKYNQSDDIQKRYIHHISYKNYFKCIRRVAYTYFMRSKNELKYKNFSIRKSNLYSS